MKKCSKCKEIKEFSEFYKNRSTKSGYGSNCKSCVKDYSIKNREHLIIYSKEYKKK